MSHGTAWGLASATAQERNRVAEQIVDKAWLHIRDRCVEAVAALLAEPLHACGLMPWERSVLVLVFEFGRILLESVLNALEPDDHKLLPREVWLGTSCYSRRRQKTRNSYVAPSFGTVVVWRRGYRSCDRRRLKAKEHWPLS